MAYNLTNHITFNAWANGKLVDVLKPLDDECYYRENKSSFPSIARTVQHMWGAQLIWSRRMNGEVVTTSPLPNIDIPKDETLTGLIESSEAFVTFIHSKDANFLAGEYSYKTLKGGAVRDTYEDTLFHVVNHGTYHRGQVVSMLRQAGIETLPGTDLIHYLRTLKK